MIGKLLELDKDLFIYLNSFHTPWLDPIMYYMSETFVWLPFYIVLFYLIYKNYKNYTWLILLGIALTILFSDQTTTSLMKPFFMRLRPSHEPQLQNVVHLVDGYRSGSLYGFASSHAANTFGIAMFLWLLLKQRYPWIILLFPWAIVVAYTRIYLGVHYPGDVLAGAFVGIFFGWAFYTFFKLIKIRMDRRKSNHVTNIT